MVVGGNKAHPVKLRVGMIKIAWWVGRDQLRRPSSPPTQHRMHRLIWGRKRRRRGRRRYRTRPARPLQDYCMMHSQLVDQPVGIFSLSFASHFCISDVFFSLSFFSACLPASKCVPCHVLCHVFVFLALVPTLFCCHVLLFPSAFPSCIPSDRHRRYKQASETKKVLEMPSTLDRVDQTRDGMARSMMCRPSWLAVLPREQPGLPPRSANRPSVPRFVVSSLCPAISGIVRA